jgi:hypothetical protein
MLARARVMSWSRLRRRIALLAAAPLRHFSHDTHALTPKSGVNLLEIEVQSFLGPSDPFSSPAGLAYAITPTGP